MNLTRQMILVLVLLSMPAWADIDYDGSYWQGLEREQISLQLPLLIIKGSRGYLACAYIDVDTCNKTGEACAIVSGVSSHNDMLRAKIKYASDAARELGIEEGMSGAKAIELLR